MRIFVTGTAGYIGSVVTEQLLAVGHEVSASVGLPALWNRLSDSRRHLHPRDYIHASDIANAHRMVLDRIGNLPSKNYNLGTGTGALNREVIAAVEEVTGKSIEIEEAPRRARDPAILVASVAKIEREIGWRAEVRSLKEMVRSAWDWNLRHPEGYANKEIGNNL